MLSIGTGSGKHYFIVFFSSEHCQRRWRIWACDHIWNPSTTEPIQSTILLERYYYLKKRRRTKSVHIRLVSLWNYIIYIIIMHLYCFIPPSKCRALKIWNTITFFLFLFGSYQLCVLILIMRYVLWWTCVGMCHCTRCYSEEG